MATYLLTAAACLARLCLVEMEQEEGNSSRHKCSVLAPYALTVVAGGYFVDVSYLVCKALQVTCLDHYQSSTAASCC